MDETNNIKVRIRMDGKTARELNPYGSEPKIGTDGFKNYMDWKKAEASLRKFEIDFSHIDPEHKKLLLNGYAPYTIANAEILENGKIKIKL